MTFLFRLLTGFDLLSHLQLPLPFYSQPPLHQILFTPRTTALLLLLLERILPIFVPAPLLVRIDLTEGDEANPITIE